MPSQPDLIQHLTTLNKITTTLNQELSVAGALQSALTDLVGLLGLETAWIFLRDETAIDKQYGSGYVLAAHVNLPPALAPDNSAAWLGGCDCQGYCNKGSLDRAYNEVACSRLAAATGDRGGLGVHASVPLYAGEHVLGILNVAAPDWESFSETSLALLTNVGSQMGIALERAFLVDRLRTRRQGEQAALLHLSNQLLARHNFTDMLHHLVEAACELLMADACALLLPCEHDQMRFRSAHGWHENPVDFDRCLPFNGRSLPGQVMQTQRPIFIPDINAAEEQETPPDWLAVEGFRGYAVMPLVVEQRSIGVMLLNTRQPRLPDDENERFLLLLANQAALTIENARLQTEEIQRQRLEDELDVARRIQLRLLPRSCPRVPGWGFTASYQAARQVGGDFYDIFQLPPQAERYGMLVADVVDKGVPAALFMALCRTMLRTTAFSGRDAAAALLRANELILNDTWGDMFLSVFYAILDTDSGLLTFANAGHNPPFHWSSQTRAITKLTTKGIVLGLFEDITIAQASVTLDPGDVVVFYTDGLTEASNAHLEEFGEARLQAVIRQHATESADQLQTAILAAVEVFVGDAPQFDDLTLLVVKRQE